MAVNRKLLLCTSMFASTMLATGAIAQTESTQSTQENSQSQATEVQQIVVTGSRIRNKEFTSASPVQVLTSAEAELRGQPDVAQTILQSTLALASFQLNDQLTGFVTAGGGGTQSVALRGAGPQRTLTILNGRRAGPSGTRGQVQAFDLGVIPGSMVERTEILKDGASSIYGSDAVAGVINIITRTDLDGARMNAFYAAPFDGGGEQVRLDGAFGRVFDRGYANVSVEYLESKAQLRRDRDYTSCTTDYTFDPRTGERQDYIDPNTGDYKCYNLNSNYVSLLDTPMSLVRTQPGYQYPTAAEGNNSAIAGWARFNRAGYPDTYLYTPSDNDYYQNSTIVSPQERYSAYFTGGYKLTENVEVYGELLYNKRKSSQIGVGQVFPSFAQLSTLYGADNAVAATNPNNPFGQRIQPVGIYESSSFQDIDYYRGILGLKGNLGKWDWDVYGQYTLSDAVYNNGPRIYLDRLLAVSSPDVACEQNPAGGNVSNFSCADLPNGLAWTDERVLTGNFTDAERNFLFFNEDHTTRYDHAYVEAVISTPELFNLPAGPVGAAFGAQIRQEKLDDLPGEQARNRNVALYSTAGQTKGDDTVKEVFAEFDLPLLRDVPFAQNLSLNVSGRYSDYDSYGDSLTYKAGVNWQMTPSVRLRSSYGTSFRAPALYEQFLGAQIGYSAQSSADPCYDYTEANSLDPKILAGCILDNASITTGGSSVAVATVGGRDLLEAETAESFSVGLILQPQFAGVSGLNIAIDYWEFKIEDAVSRLGASAIIERCYEQSTAGTLDSGYCSLYQRTRNPGASDDGKLASVNDAYVNVAEQNYRGIDVSLNWSFDLLNLGRMTISSQNSYKMEDSETFDGVTTDYLGNSFNYNGPRYTGQLAFNLDRGNWGYYYGITFIGRSSDVDKNGGDIFANSKYANLPGGINSNDCTQPNSYCSRYVLRTPLHDNHSASVRYRGDGWNMTVGMQNIWDKAPPTVGAGMFRMGNAALNGYDMRGRRMSISFGKTF
ncbi:TonB-dependent receptor [Brevundimonas terrae]|uniref:TonB-dependent receptor n=1 Tax=Brevundimonas terrae TaxID=363631 RepID=A0ABN0YDN5_9CAUL|nr:TonB-dependent receptor [Brevundimonas terrae]NIJ26350.1 iron complex outermembrane receptor protein [Brevundimonas terrae]